MTHACNWSTLSCVGGLLLTIGLAGGCAPKPAVKDSTDAAKHTSGTLRNPVRLESIRVEAKRDKERLSIESYDASGLFGQAADHFHNNRYEEAIEVYSKLVKEFPESSFLSAALYNSGLSLEKLGKYQQAADVYLRITEEFPDSDDVTDSLFRATGALEQLEAWDDIIRTLNKLLYERKDVEAIERIEALARKGSALVNLRDHENARLVLKEAVNSYRSGRGISPSATTYYFGMARFKLGEILHTEMREAELPAQEDLLEPALEKKCQLLLDAQDEYTRTIKVLHPHWAAAAAYRIGNLYRTLWDDMLAAKPPEDLSDEEKEIYAEVLRKRIKVLLTKAVAQWERTLKMSRRLEMSNEWVERTEHDLAEIRETLKIERVGDNDLGSDDDDVDAGENKAEADKAGADKKETTPAE